MFAAKLAEMATIKEVLTSAESLAYEMGDKEPGSEHLLLAAIDLPDGLARRTFEQVGADPDGFATAIVRQHEAALAAAGIESPNKPPTHIPASDRKPMNLGPSARSAFQRATKLAKTYRPASFGGAHIVIAVAEQEQGTAVRALAGMGVDRGRLRDAAIEQLRN
jgi:ATP-dependent Clp protease ATP-binding subunit ClpA